jgi:putative aldouronate transport system permease protein
LNKDFGEKEENAMRDSNGDKIFYVCNYVLLTIIGFSCLLPLVHIFSVSLSDSHYVMSGKVSFWPMGATLHNYNLLFQGTNIIRALLNSVVITVGGVVLSMLFTILAAYPLSRKYFIGRRFYSLAIVFTMLFSGGLIPTFLVVRGLGLLDSYGAIWLPGLISVFNMLVMRSFFENIPEELMEAASMDGAGEWRLIVRMVLPLSLPVLATLALFYGVHYWNAFMNVLIYINDSSKYNLTVLVQQMIKSSTLVAELENIQREDTMAITPVSIRAAGIVVMIVPMLIVYPFLQKYFVKGVMLGSIKG